MEQRLAVVRELVFNLEQGRNRDTLLPRHCGTGGT
jgi:hypothetical protein